MNPLQGKTYSLITGPAAGGDYFKTIKQLAGTCLETFPGNDPKSCLRLLRKASKKRKISPSWFEKEAGKGFAGFITEELVPALSVYTKGVKPHLRKMSLLQRFDRTLRTAESQYLLYMLEIELVNRISKAAFLQCEYKFALFPHCVRDFRAKCLSAPGDVEHICKGCTKECHIHRGGQLLKQHGIEPYISVTIEQDKLLKEIKEKHPSVGVIGIACIPELAMGMRLALHLGMPPLGVPLDANRCSRWLGTARETSFNLDQLESLIT